MDSPHADRGDLRRQVAEAACQHAAELLSVDAGAFEVTAVNTRWVRLLMGDYTLVYQVDGGQGQPVVWGLFPRGGGPPARWGRVTAPADLEDLVPRAQVPS
jgi:hypothetical protein